jgi:hypothetical protein
MFTSIERREAMKGTSSGDGRRELATRDREAMYGRNAREDGKKILPGEISREVYG